MKQVSARLGSFSWCLHWSLLLLSCFNHITHHVCVWMWITTVYLYWLHSEQGYGVDRCNVRSLGQVEDDLQVCRCLCSSRGCYYTQVYNETWLKLKLRKAAHCTVLITSSRWLSPCAWTVYLTHTHTCSACFVLCDFVAFHITPLFTCLCVFIYISCACLL